MTTHVRNRRSRCDDERFEQPGVAIAGDEGVPSRNMKDAEQLRNELNRAAIALRDVEGVREVNMGRI